jgi:hypothetical protein
MNSNSTDVEIVGTNHLSLKFLIGPDGQHVTDLEMAS